MPSIWNFSTIEQRKMKLGFSSINWDVMLDAIEGPAINGTPAFWTIGANARTLPLDTVPMMRGTLSLCNSRWTSETAFCGLASSS